RAVLLHRLAQLFGVGQVAVVRDRDRAARGLRGDLLRVAQVRAAGGRIADVADRAMAGQPAQALSAEDVGDPAHRLLDVEVVAVGRGDARGLLAPMLERVETE